MMLMRVLAPNHTRHSLLSDVLARGTTLSEASTIVDASERCVVLWGAAAPKAIEHSGVVQPRALGC
jgi:hypothetical protein